MSPDDETVRLWCSELERHGSLDGCAVPMHGLCRVQAGPKQGLCSGLSEL